VLRTASTHPPLEIAVSRQEEVGLLGAKNLDFSRITARRGLLLDNDTLETIVVGGPSYFALDVTVTGKAAHAGMEPERGINAIQAAARAIAALRLGRLDAQSTANVGIVEGGLIRNGVPERCRFFAECRSSVHEHGQQLAADMARVIREQVEAYGAQAEVVVDNLCRASRVPDDAPTVRLAQAGLRAVGVEARPVYISGFTDASIYNEHGIEMAVIGIGARNEHSTDECVAVADMERAARALTEMLRLAAE